MQRLPVLALGVPNWLDFRLEGLDWSDSEASEKVDLSAHLQLEFLLRWTSLHSEPGLSFGADCSLSAPPVGTDPVSPDASAAL